MEPNAAQIPIPKSKPTSASDAKGDLKSLPMPEVEKRLGLSPDGLSQAEAHKRLTQYGPNELEEKKTNLFLKFLTYFWGPIPWMIEAAVILSAVARHWPDFGIILVLLLSNAVVGFWEEHQAGNAIAALKAKLAIKARVIRDGKWINPPARDLVPGDVIRMRLGDIVPADARRSSSISATHISEKLEPLVCAIFHAAIALPSIHSPVSRTRDRPACAKRLKQLGAPVKELAGSAVVSAKTVAAAVNQYGLHAAFLDPYNLGELDFSIINALSQLKRIDMLIHVSAMDLQRNLERNLAATNGPFDVFAPGWRDAVNTNTSQTEVRRLVVEYWRAQVAKLGVWPSIEMKLITGEKNQRLYWLLLAAKHDLAHSFWEVAANAQGQGKLF